MVKRGIVVPIAATMIVALWAGLSRLGWSFGAAPRVVVAHGPLMIVGVMGTVISLERAVAVNRAWAFVAPVASLAAALGLVFGLPWHVCAWMSVIGGALLVVALAELSRRGRDLATAIIGLGGLAYLAGCVRWATGAPIFAALPFWTTWLVVTIAGERLELTRLMPPSRFARVTLVAALGGLAISLFLLAIVRGVATLAVAAWLLRFDVARRVIKKAGLPRFTAITLLSGYVWLAIAGAIPIAYGDAIAGPIYDASTHALLLGFVFTMIFGHAPTILPAVIGASLPFHRAFYVHVALLHVGLVMRIAGDLAGIAPLRAWGGLVNAIAIVTFVAITAGRSLYVQRKHRRARAGA